MTYDDLKSELGYTDQKFEEWNASEVDRWKDWTSEVEI
jgi:hypothetical protein